MTQKEICSLVALAVANFPHTQDKDMSPTAKLWEHALADMPYELAQAAVLRVISSSRYFPTVAEIREMALSLIHSDTVNSTEAWYEVIRAVRNYGYYRSTEALKSLSPDVLKIVKLIGWTTITLSENPEEIRIRFCKAYDQIQKREKDEKIISLNPVEKVKFIGSSK